MGKPIFAFFLIHRCRDCKPYFPIWETIVPKYDNDTNFVLAEADCRRYPSLRTIFQIGFVPSFLEIYRGNTSFKNVESSLDSFEQTISSIINDAISNNTKADSNETDPRLYRSSLNTYPIFVIGGLFSNPIELIDKYEQLYPHLQDHFYYTNDTSTKGFMIPFESKTIFYENDSYSTDFDSFIYEYSFNSLGDWKLSDAINTSRRFAFIVYNSPNQCNIYELVIRKYYDRIIFGKISYKEFHHYFPSIAIPLKYIPSIAVANKFKTSFSIVNTKRGFARVLNSILDKNDEYDSGMSLYPIFPTAKQPTKPYLQYLCFALAVISFTMLIIILDAKKCIRSYQYKRKILL